jgi:hypothetical protein
VTKPGLLSLVMPLLTPRRPMSRARVTKPGLLSLVMPLLTPRRPMSRARVTKPGLLSLVMPLPMRRARVTKPSLLSLVMPLPTPRRLMSRVTTEMPRPSDQNTPIRTCIGCRQRRPQAELLRCVLDADGVVHLDRHAPGRGAWLCGPGCIEPARRRRAFDRAWRTKVPTASIDRLATELTDQTN